MRNQSRDGAMTISYRRKQSHAGSSENQEEGEGLVYFIETEAEEIY